MWDMQKAYCRLTTVQCCCTHPHLSESHSCFQTGV
jgi:hypothetical protein